MHRARVAVLSVLAVLLLVVLAACNQATAPAPSPEHSMSLSPVTLDTGLAGSATTTLLLASQSGFSGTLGLGVLDGSGNPAFGVSLKPADVTLAAGQSVSLPVKVTAVAALPAGTYSLTLNASGGGVAHASPLTLVLSSTATGGFPTSTAPTYTVGSYPVSVAVGDFNGDGKPDLAVANYGSNNVSVLLGQ